MTEAPEITPGMAFLLGWLSGEEWSSYGECQGKDFDALLERGLVEKHKSNKSGIDERYDLCRVTESGWAVINDMRAKGTLQ